MSLILIEFVFHFVETIFWHHRKVEMCKKYIFKTD